MGRKLGLDQIITLILRDILMPYGGYTSRIAKIIISGRKAKDMGKSCDPITLHSGFFFHLDGKWW